MSAVSDQRSTRREKMLVLRKWDIRQLASSRLKSMFKQALRRSELSSE